MNTTMSSVQEDTITSILAHMNRLGGNPDRWNIGIASNIRKKLFEDLKISEENGKWIYSTLESNLAANEVKKHFVSLGLNANPSDDDNVGDVIFAYQKSIT